MSISNDKECANLAGSNLESGAVLIDPAGHIQNVFVYVKDGLDPGYTFASPTTSIVIDQRRCQFSPRVVGVRVGQAVEVTNSDPTLHGVHAHAEVNQPFNIGQPLQGVHFTHRFTAPEVMVPLSSDFQPWMMAFIGIVSHPFFAVTAADGSFNLRGLPPGTYEIEAWHEKFGTAVQRVTIGPDQTARLSFTFSN